jgi:NAD(P)-dependent dehydrogenase (short-subunit alcohol dehydrogenase family)
MYLENLFGLKGKVVIVTGGSRGIGQVVAIGLAKAGAEVAIFSRSKATETVNDILKEGGKAYSIQVDVTDEAGVEAAVNEVLRRSGSVDIVFNNAGACT